MKKVLVIEDEIKINKMIYDHFTHVGFDVISAYDGQEGISLLLDKKNIDLIILDVMLPKIDGFSVLEVIRKNYTTPVIMVTARGDKKDVLRGYALKADDYIIKPFNIEILIAKVNVLLNRIDSLSDNKEEKENYIQIKGIKIDKLKSKVYIDNDEIQLERKQFEILKYLVDNKNITISRENLLDNLWGVDYFGNDRVVDAQIKKLRKNLNHKAYLIKTVFGIGYKFDEE